MTISRLAGYIAVGFIGLVGCNATQTGQQGLLGFTPESCGNNLATVGCNFDRAIAVGGKIEVKVAVLEADTVALDEVASLASRPSEPPLFSSLVPLQRDQTSASWSLVGGPAPGDGELVALRSDGGEVDSVLIRVEPIQALDVLALEDDTVKTRGTDEDPYDVVFDVMAGRNSTFLARPVMFDPDKGEDVALMGTFAYAIDNLTPGLEEHIDASSQMENGTITFDGTAGEYDLTFVLRELESELADDHALIVRIRAQ